MSFLLLQELVDKSHNIFITGLSLPVHDPAWLSILLWTVGGFAVFYYFPPSPNGLK
jgi:hypothetical protein